MAVGKARHLANLVPTRPLMSGKPIIRRGPYMPLQILGHVVHHPARKARMNRLQHAVCADQTGPTGTKTHPQTFAGAEKRRDYAQRLTVSRHEFLKLKAIEAIQGIMRSQPQVPISGLRKRSY